MKHLVRAGALIAILIAGLLLFNLIPVPAFFERYGFYRGGDNVEEWSSQPIHYVGSTSCNDCHQDEYTAWGESKHGTVSCEACHGPAKAHLNVSTSLIVDTSREFCGLCHASLLSRPNDFPQVDVEKHGGQLECITCHNAHDPGVVAPPEIPHTLEGRTDCLLCHQVGGLKPFPEDHTGHSIDTCLSCHWR